MMENKEKNIDSSMDDELKSTLAYHEDDASPISSDDHEEVVEISEEVYGEAYVIRDGNVSELCRHEKMCVLKG